MKNDNQLVHELKQAVEGLVMVSESDYPFEVVRWDGVASLSDNYLCQAAGRFHEPVRMQSVEEFFAPMMSEAKWKNEEGIALARRFQQLAEWLKENLSEVKAYRIGDINIQVYIVGRGGAPDKWLGLSTRAVET